ncbi:uncharacterized protein LOC143817464 [Ranitomeya variabilis]|uniref:uncharacterized protein LOC143817464 n=1 Tax=Ranitomeya variabilis TaxID=490064 RepID=UPI004057202D
MDLPKMDDRSHMAARILDLTLDIIYWITGEEHKVVKMSSAECVTSRVSGGWSRTPSDTTEPPPHSLIHEQKILELTHRITELLSGEMGPDLEIHQREVPVLYIPRIIQRRSRMSSWIIRKVIAV